MPSCAVKVCGNRSNVTNYKTSGVTYHRFPKSPKFKERWIEATGRGEDWFPTQHSAVCSAHFEEEQFLPSDRTRRLIPTAVPTLKLRFTFLETNDTQNEISKKKVVIKQESNVAQPQPTSGHSKVKMTKYENALKAQRLLIKRLRKNLQRERKKLKIVTKVLKALNNENAIGDNHRWLLEMV